MTTDLATTGSDELIPIEEKSPKNRLLAFSLACLGGFLGLHRFYAGRFWTGLLMLFSFGGFFLWWIIDVFVLLSGRFKDGQGRVLGPARHVRRPTRGHLTDHRQGPDNALDGGEDDVSMDELLDDPLAEEFAELERQQRGTDGRV